MHSTGGNVRYFSALVLSCAQFRTKINLLIISAHSFELCK